MDTFQSKSVKELQKYLKERGVTFSNSKKVELIELCKCAAEVNIEIDPDGLVEDREEVLRAKLCLNGQTLVNPQLLVATEDLSRTPTLSIFDMYNFLLGHEGYSHDTLREYHKLEGYTMFKDGYVVSLKLAAYDTQDCVALLAKVKPRTKDKDPITNLKYYQCWLILGSSGCIHSAYCTCKGGIDGCCRHVVATFFEALDFTQDEGKISSTSKPCKWRRRACEADKVSQPIPATQLDTSVLTSSSLQSPKPNYCPLPDDAAIPDPNIFFNQLQALCPKACLLKSVFHSRTDSISTPPLTVTPPMEKLASFVKSHKCIVDTCSCSTIFLHYHLAYTPEECTEIEAITKEQSKNNNWHVLRKGLLTASNFKLICCSTNGDKTAQSLMKPSLNESCLPPAVSFGRKYEHKARTMFIKGHRFRHRQCSVDVPGLVMYQDSSFPGIACSPDGIVNCSICGKFLVEIKCLFKYKCFHPKNALKLSGICEEKDGQLVLKHTHKYYYQIQGQMALTGINKSYLVLYTHKGIATVNVDFDTEFWFSVRSKLFWFYRDYYFSELKKSIL